MPAPEDKSCSIWPDFEVDTVAFPAGMDMQEITGSPRAGGDYQIQNGFHSFLQSHWHRYPTGRRV